MKMQIYCFIIIFSHSYRLLAKFVIVLSLENSSYTICTYIQMAVPSSTHVCLCVCVGSRCRRTN